MITTKHKNLKGAIPDIIQAKSNKQIFNHWFKVVVIGRERGSDVQQSASWCISQ